MPEVPSDIQQRIVDDFGETNAADVLNHLLTRVPEGLPNGTHPRHLRCILYLGDGDKQKLDQYIDMCLGDPRDVMLHAEYDVAEGAELVRKRDFNKPFPKI